jgi:eukaryotic-like serine/threonine-protein kinase
MTAPKRIGKYEIADQIGVGGFGVVYKAWDPYIQRWVALKTCAATDEEATQRFFREAQLAGALQHPNITLIFDFGIDDGTPYFVQEFLSGKDLDDLVERTQLSLEGILAILIQVCVGLEFAHSRGIVHRDIKPANVRVLEDGTVKIMDFGIAKSLQAESRLTQTGVALGTAGYLAPEQLSGKPLDSRTDIFSLGVMAYELIAGARPFAGPNISNVIYQILHQDPVAPRQRNSRCPERLEKAILKALAKDPDERWATVRDVGQELKEVLASLSARTQAQRTETTTALVRGELARLAGRPSRNLTAPTQLAARPLDHLPTEHVPPKEPSKRRILWVLAPVAVVTVAVLGWLAFRGIAETSVADTPAERSTPIPATPVLGPSPAPIPTPSLQRVSVELFVDPVSEIEVDGVSLGKVQSTRVDLTVGGHRIRQRIPGYRDKVHTVEVTTQTTQLKLHLPPFGLLTVVNDFGVPVQGARVYLDDEELGALPVKDRKVPAGVHTLVINWPGRGEYREQVEIPPGVSVPRVVAPQ